mmetsp:Transcript_11928/g.33456  ORF Transcript_11928/g.33456 Transcript_11928/m.33456 type:complete len:221 (+) Transcript_11928:911-1573(+)
MRLQLHVQDVLDPLPEDVHVRVQEEHPLKGEAPHVQLLEAVAPASEEASAAILAAMVLAPIVHLDEVPADVLELRFVLRLHTFDHHREPRDVGHVLLQGEREHRCSIDVVQEIAPRVRDYSSGAHRTLVASLIQRHLLRLVHDPLEGLQIHSRPAQVGELVPPAAGQARDRWLHIDLDPHGGAEQQSSRQAGHCTEGHAAHDESARVGRMELFGRRGNFT